MELTRLPKLIALIQNKHTTYKELVEFLFNETPPEDHDFLSRIDISAIPHRVASEAYSNDPLHRITPNENPSARICFLIYYPFHYFLYKNIHCHLQESEFAIDVPWIKHNIKNWPEYVENLLSFLKGKQVPFRILYDDRNALPFFKKYSTFIFHTTTKYLLKDLPTQRKIRAMYGHSKDSYDFGPWSRFYDLALVYGPYSDSHMKMFTKSIAVGNPRFDDWWNGEAQKNSSSLSFLRRLDPKKKTALYAPTHGALCSLEHFAKEAGRVAKTYNLVIRPHPITLYKEEERLEKFRSAIGAAVSEKIIWDSDHSDMTQMLAVSDLMISDNSGAIFDAVLADKPVVLIDFLEDGYFQKEILETRQHSAGDWNIPLTYPDSIEQRIKRETGIQPGGTVNTKSASIADTISETLREEETYKISRKKLRDELFSGRDGKAGKRAAEAIRDLEKKPPRHWTFLDYAAEEGSAWETVHLKQHIADLNKISSYYCRIPDEPEAHEEGLEPIEYSIVLPTYNGTERIKEALYPIVFQEKINLRRYEIIIIDDGSHERCDKIVEELKEKNRNLKITYVWYKENRGPAFAKNVGIKLARGKFVCFTDDDCLVPRDWLSTFEKLFKQNPEVSGAGGWYMPDTNSKNKPTIYDNFIYWCHLPEILSPHKSVARNKNKAGNTGNICYRKAALLKIGGFNHYFRYPSLEDWELKTRMHENAFSLLFKPNGALHKKRQPFFKFLDHFLLRGWAAYLLYLIHPQMEEFNYNVYTTTLFSLWEIPRIIAKKKIQTANIPPFSYLFIPLNFIRNFCFWFGKYWIAAKIANDKISD